MLNKNYDYALIGHNYLAFFMGINLIKKGKSVLILDDDRFNYGDFFSNSLTQMDLDFIEHISELNQLGLSNWTTELINIEERYFFLGRKQLRIGLSPRENLKELLRKFPHFFKTSSEEFLDENFLIQFEKEYFEFSKNLAAKIYRPVKKISMYQIFQELSGTNLKKVFDSFIAAVLNRNDERLKNDNEMNNELSLFIYLGRSFFHSHLTLFGSKVELYHFLMCVLSPYYCLDHKKLNQMMSDHFKSLGGEVNNLNLSDIKHQNGEVKGLLLESFEGHIDPKKIVFVGGHSLGLPIKFENNKSILNCLNLKLKLKKIPDNLNGKKIIYSSYLKMHTKFPMFEADFEGEFLNLNIVMAKKNGTKSSFVTNQLLAELKNDFNYLFKDLEILSDNLEMNFTHDIFIEDRNMKVEMSNNLDNDNRLTQLLFRNGPLKFNRPKNVYYLGPYNDGQLGTYSSLIEIGKWQDRI